jgi:hypothetical protein
VDEVLKLLDLELELTELAWCERLPEDPLWIDFKLLPLALLLPLPTLSVELPLPPAAKAELFELTEVVVSVELLTNDWPVSPVEDDIFLLKLLKALVSTICLILSCWGPGFTWEGVSDVAYEGDNFAGAIIINTINAKIRNTSL